MMRGEGWEGEEERERRRENRRQTHRHTDGGGELSSGYLIEFEDV
jgi:hypothetical protein